MFDKYNLWYSPTGYYDTLQEIILSDTHVLIAGCTGSGKSVLLNSLIHTALLRNPAQVGFALIDPKRIDLVQYRDLPHTDIYRSDPHECYLLLKNVLDLIERRYKHVQNGGAMPKREMYVIIDELADLMTVNKKEIMPVLQRILQTGRAANVHVIACTQCPIVQVIPTQLKVNFTLCVGLHTRSAQDSRNIIGRNGCEQLPRYGKCILALPDGWKMADVRKIPDEEIGSRIAWWAAQRTKRGRVRLAKQRIKKYGSLDPNVELQNKTIALANAAQPVKIRGAQYYY